MTSTILSHGALNRTVLARRLLLDPSRLSLPRALERMAGFQDQNPQLHRTLVATPGVAHLTRR